MDLFNDNAWDFIKTLPDKSIDCIITDPMYDQPLLVG